MPSPFPGMDPYLEGRLWPEVHASLIYTIKSALAASLPDGYFVETHEYVWLCAEPPEKRRRGGSPDVFLANGTLTGHPSSATTVAVAAAEPTVRVTLSSAAAVEKKRYLRVVDADNDRVVTVIELLSPSDKLPRDDRVRYLAKRDEYLGGRANLVEFDLLRKGRRLPMGEPEPPDADYYIVVTRAAEYPVAGVWAFTVHDRIPVIPVPLDPDQAAVPLDLRACLDKAYDDARLAKRIEYSAPATPALRAPDAAWAAGFLAGRTGG